MVHQRLCMTREMETWLSDSRVSNSSVVDHIDVMECNCLYICAAQRLSISLHTCRSSAVPRSLGIPTSCQWTTPTVILVDGPPQLHQPAGLPVPEWAGPEAETDQWLTPSSLETLICGTLPCCMTDSHHDDRPALQSTRGPPIMSMWCDMCVCVVDLHSALSFVCYTLPERKWQQQQHPFNSLHLGLPGWASTRKVKPVWILQYQETVSGSGISWAICKSAPPDR